MENLYHDCLSLTLYLEGGKKSKLKWNLDNIFDMLFSKNFFFGENVIICYKIKYVVTQTLTLT